MAQVKIGPHFIPTHHRPQDMDFVAACPSPSAKIVYSSKPDVGHLREVMRRAPGRVVLRDHALSEQHDDIWRDPAGTGIRHAREWKQHLDEIGGLDLDRITIEGVNEFPHWEPGGITAQVAYELAFGNEGQRLGINTHHCQFPPGWPGNEGIADAPPDWTPWEPVLAWIDAHPGTFLGLHEYWGYNTGVHFYAGWWFLRYRQMPHKVATELTELGGLRARQNADGTWGLIARDGWKGDEQKGDGISAEQYLAQMQQAELEIRTDSYIHGAHLFTTDGAHPWIEECDAEPINQLWLDWAKGLAALPLQPTPTRPETPGGAHIIHLPTTPNDGPTPPTAEAPEPQSQPTPIETHLPYDIIDPYVAEAVMQVESGNAGFNADGRLKIRVEAHLLVDARWGNPAAMDAHFLYNPDNYLQAWYRDDGGQWIEYHELGQAGEWAAFELALRLDRGAALRCTSMGASQVMGFNHAKIGYETVEDMYQAFRRSQNVHALAFDNYCRATPDLVAAINARDWPTIGMLYNGAASAGDKYKAAYHQLWGA